MTDKAKYIKDTLDTVRVSREDLNKLCEDRLAYIYDSLCFRYIIAREKVALYEFEEARKAGKTHDKNYYLNLAKRDEMRFFEILNDLIGEHK